MMQNRLVRVVKVGGSLFDFPQLVTALRTWLNTQPPARNVLVAGGGRFADLIRQADRTFSLGEETSHWLCVDALRVSARLLAGLLPESPLVTVLARLKTAIAESEAGETIVFSPDHFMQNDSSLPHAWSVTTDSIAARLAEVLQADELALLKSSDPPAKGEAVGGYVDQYFPIAARNVRKIRFVNLPATASSEQ